MNKEDLLNQIAQSGYSSGYGAKLSYSSYDMLRFAPGLIAFLLTSLGILGLAYEPLTTKTVSAAALCFGLLSFYLNPKEKRLSELKKSGDTLTRIRDELGELYAQVKASSGLSVEEAVGKLRELREEARKCCISGQLIFSGWFAHYKFFGEARLAWVENELKLTFWKDKIPASAKLLLYLLIAGSIAWFVVPLFMRAR